MNQIQTSEMISALADGQLRDEAFSRGVETITGDQLAQETWRTYHMIGDVMRSGELSAGTDPAVFVSRFQKRLSQEPMFETKSNANNLVAVETQPTAASLLQLEKPAANDASFRWKMIAGCASLAAVAAIGWTALGGIGGSTSQPGSAELAAVSSQSGAVPTSGERGVMLRDARLDELLAAHRQFGGASALQMPAGFLRNATFEGPAR